MPIIPSIDLIKGNAVQLVGGKEENLRVNAGDPVPIALKFRLAGEIAVVDLDAALGKGSNQETILKLLKVADCRVGGGIRSVESALYWLNAGASKVVLGTAATPEVLSQLPKDRVVAALDAVEGEVVVKGWTTKTGKSVFERVIELKPYVKGFLVTFVEKEGRMQGFDMEFVKKLVEAVGKDHTLTVAGGVTTAQHIADLDKLGVEAQVGMALYTNTMDLGEAIAAPLVSDRPDGLFPTVVADENGHTLGMAFSSVESIKEAVRTQRGVYHSRKRGIWIKGETSGATQDLLQISLDCDRDTLCFKVRQHGSGFCHNDTYSCFDSPSNKFTQHGIAALTRTLENRKKNPVEKSYTNRLMNDDALLHAKIMEEAKELVEAQNKDDVAWEVADVIYFALAKAVSKGVSLADIERHLQLRSLRVTRRAGEAKVPLDNNNNNNNAVTTPAPAPAKTESKPVEVSLKPATANEVYSMELEAIDAETLNKVRNIITDVKTKGLEGVLHYATLFGDIKTGDSLFYTRDELKAIFDQIPQEQQQMLIRTSTRIRAFAQHQRNCLTDLNVSVEGGGGRCGHTVAAVDRAGCYAPGGRFPLPSSVLMTVITARVAGVKTVWVASPRPSQITAAAAYVAGADSMLKIGGAQAIAAFAYGCGETIPAMDVIVGPGNRWVTAAKQLVSGKVKIDMLAGPSECLVVADESADARLVASDLIAQAEHDPDARPLLISIDDKGLADQVNQELNSQLKQLPEGNANIASLSINNNGLVVKVSSLEEAASISDKLAAEHLELHVKDSHGAASKFNHYGGLFIGSLAAEVFGDYGAGPNHVLPTGSTARYTGGLSVFTFLRIRTWLQMTEYTPTLVQLCQDCHMLAEAEGLYGHAAAAKKRLEVSQTVLPAAALEITSYLRPDLPNLDHYTPVKPLDVLAAEIGISMESLIKLDANENMYGPHPKVFEAITKAPLHIYPDPSHNHINASIAKYVGVQQNQIVSGSGSDDILDILIRLVDPHTVVITTPTFGMYSFLGKIAKSKIEDVPTDADFKVNVSAVIDKIQFHLARNERVIAFFASPNNPTGTLLPNSDIEALCSKSNCLVVIDEAYAEFSRTSSIPLVAKYPNLIVVRTFSKWAGLAGLRVGFSVSTPQLAQYMAQIKQPYNVNVAADVAVRTSLEHKDDIMVSVNTLISLRDELFAKLQGYSWLRPVPSQANFILNQVVDGRSAFALWSFLRQRGIFTRFFNTSRLQNYVRISIGRPEDLNKLYSYLDKFHQRDLTSIQADCILFDMDGVLADVSKSYRLAILDTCAHFGAQITSDDIVALKSKGNANNDWKVSHQLIIEKIGEAKSPSYEQVVEKFEEFYQGTPSVKGMWESETLCITEDLLKHLHSKVPLAIVTGRPRKDAIKFLKHFNIEQYFKAVVCMEDAPVKPSPKPVELAMKLLGTKRGVMIGDTVDDIKAAIGAGVVALGIPAPQETGNEKAFLTLQNCGAFKVVKSLDELAQVL